jgi:predicted Fe-Mo cluster-binding NifX family protein
VDALQDCSVLVARGMGPRLRADLSERGIDAFITAEQKVEEAAKQFATGRLERAAQGGACPHG